MYLHRGKYENILDIRNNEQEIRAKYASRLYFPVILDDIIPRRASEAIAYHLELLPTRADQLSRTRAHIRRVRGTHHKSALRILALA